MSRHKKAELESWPICETHGDAIGACMPCEIDYASRLPTTLGDKAATSQVEYIAFKAMRAALHLFLSEIPLVRGNATGMWSYAENWEEKARAALVLADKVEKP